MKLLMIKFFTFLLAISAFTCYAQDMSYTKNGFVSYDSQTLKKPEEILQILRTRESDALLQTFNKYKSNRIGATIFATIGGFGIGWSVGDFIMKGKPNTDFFSGWSGSFRHRADI